MSEAKPSGVGAKAVVIAGIVLISLVAAVIFLQQTPSRPESTQTTITSVAAGPPVVRIGSFSTAVDYAPYLIAKNKGWFADALKQYGAKPEFVLFQSLPPINESFATKRVDVVFEAEPPAIVAAAANIDVRIEGISCSLVQEILVPEQSSVRSAGDLRGKKIAVLAGTSSHYGLLKILRDAGVEKDAVQVVDMIPPDARIAFETGKVDAWAVWPPWVEQQEIAGKGRVLPRGAAMIHSIMAVRGGFADEYPAVTGALQGVLEKSKKWIQDNPAEAQSIVAKELDVPLDVVTRAWPRHTWNATLGKPVVDDIQLKADFLAENGFVRQRVDANKIIAVRP